MVETDWTSRLISLLLGIIGALETPARQTLNLALSHTRSAAMRKCAACLWGRRDVVGISHTNTALTECTCVHAYVIVYNYVFIFYEYYIYIRIYVYISISISNISGLAEQVMQRLQIQERSPIPKEWPAPGVVLSTSTGTTVPHILFIYSHICSYGQCNTTWHR